jgi:hypothetical protein
MIINMIGGGGGGTGGTLVVSAPAGVTVTATKDDKTYTRVASAEGVATFKGLSSGTWMLSIDDAEHDPSTPVPVEIKADYTVTLKFFAATINVTYPAGSTLTCTDGNITLTAPDTSGSYTFTVPNAGTWTVSSTNGSQNVSKAVSITTDGQSASVTLSYFSATIDITYPATSNCVVTDSSGVTVASDSNTGSDAKTWTATVTAAGTYTVTATATDGSGNTISRDISIATDGQSASLTLSYILYLYYRGDLLEENSGGWGKNSDLVQFNADHIFLGGATAYQVFIHDRVSIPDGFNKLVVVGEAVSQVNYVCFQNCGLVLTSDLAGEDVAAIWHEGTLGAFTKTVDISSVTDRSTRVVKIGVGFSDLCDGKIYEVYVTS